MLKLMKISVQEILIFGFILLLHTAGIIIFYKNPGFFRERYIVEDGPIEWLTVAGLLIGMFVCFYRSFTNFRKRNILFHITTIGLGLLLFFVAGEEISWGQRIFNIQSSEYFTQNNLQGETNLHNLEINGVKLNKVVFSVILFSAVALYLIATPLLYRLNNTMRDFINYAGIPVPKVFHIAGFVLFFLLTELITDGKKSEIMEFAGAFMFLLIVWYPVNSKELYR
jgi:hypothetical protein